MVYDHVLATLAGTRVSPEHASQLAAITRPSVLDATVQTLAKTRRPPSALPVRQGDANAHVASRLAAAIITAGGVQVLPEDAASLYRELLSELKAGMDQMQPSPDE